MTPQGICPHCKMGVMLPYSDYEECNICYHVVEKPVYIQGLGWMDDEHMEKMEGELKKRGMKDYD